MQAMFSRTGSADFPSYLKCMISGPPKSGKTHFLGTVPNILILDTEPHANNLQTLAHLDIPFKAIYGTDDLRQAQFVLSNDGLRQQAAQALGMDKIEAVSIDTLDTLQAIMKRERMKEQRSSKFLRDDWGWLKEEMVSILESFLSLPMHVFFVVHTKTKDIGSEENPQTIVLPGLEGSIAESIAGMVGYSLLSYRDEQIRPDGSKFTKYWLRAEGNDTYQFLGNRAAGRLPDVIEPDFKVLHDSAMAGRPTKEQRQVSMEFQTTGQMQQQAPAAPAAPPAQPAPPAAPAQPAAPTTPATPAAPTAPASEPVASEPVAQNPGQPPAQPTGVPQNLPSDDEPVNAAAVGALKRIYDACGQPFPEDKVKALNLGQARDLARTWKAIQQDRAEGKGPEPVGAMVEHLHMMDLLGGEVAAKPGADPMVDGTIEQVKAYATDLTKVQEAYDLESAKDSPRKGLIQWLESQGAKPTQVQTPVETAPAPAQAQEPPVTQPQGPVDQSPTEEQAVQTVKEALGAEVVSRGVNADTPCEVCHNPIDDVDLAELGVSRFGKVLCVSDYLAETKK